MAESKTPILNLYQSRGLQGTKIYQFVEYKLEKSFNNFVQSVVDARREGDKNPHSRVVAETMKLLGNSKLLGSSSYSYQIMTNPDKR